MGTNEREVRRGILGLSRRRIRGTRLLMVMTWVGKRETVLGVKKIVTGVTKIVTEMIETVLRVIMATTQIVREKGTWEMIVVGEIVKEVNVIGVTVTEEITRGVVVIRGIRPEVTMTGWIVTEVIGTEGITTEGIMTEVIGVTVIRMVLTEGIVMWTGEGMKVVIVIGLVGKKGIMMQKKITRVQLISTRLGRETRMKIVADIVT